MAFYRDDQSKASLLCVVDDSTLVVDCEGVVEQHGDSAVIRQLAQQVGYAPIFNWLNFFSSLLDLAAQGMNLDKVTKNRDHWTEGWVY
jgi:hypothetical protein